MKVRPKIRNPEAVDDARRLVQAGADTELVLVFLRDRGLDKTDSIYAAEALFGKKFSEAKSLVHHSRAWSDRYELDTELMEKAREALRELAASNSADLPRIIFDEDDESER